MTELYAEFLALVFTNEKPWATPAGAES